MKHPTMMKFIVTVILLCLLVPREILASSAAANKAAEEAKKKDILSFCNGLGIKEPSLMQISGRDTSKLCSEHAGKLLSYWSLDAIQTAHLRLSNSDESSEDQIKSLSKSLDMFKSTGWNSNMLIAFCKHVYIYKEKRKQLIKGITDYGKAEYWSPVIGYMGKVDDSVFNFLYTLVTNEQFRTPFEIYLKWTLENKGVCPSDLLENAFNYLLKNPNSNDAYNKMFNVVCSHSKNKYRLPFDKWDSGKFTTLISKVPNPPFDQHILFLEYGAGTVEALIKNKDLIKRLGWDWSEVFTFIVQCQKDMTQSTADAVRGAILIDMKRSSFDKVLKDSQSKDVDRVQFLTFIGALGDSTYDLDSRDTDQEILNFLLDAYNYQKQFLESIKRDIEIHMTQTLNICRHFQFRMEDLDKVIKAANNNGNPLLRASELNAYLGCLTFALKPTEQVLKMIPFLNKLNITDKEIWARIQKINASRPDLYLDPYNFYELHQAIEKVKAGGATAAVQSFFTNPNIKWCNSNLVKEVANYDVAIGNKLQPDKLRAYYNIGCTVKDAHIFIDFFKTAAKQQSDPNAVLKDLNR